MATPEFPVYTISSVEKPYPGDLSYVPRTLGQIIAGFDGVSDVPYAAAMCVGPGQGERVTAIFNNGGDSAGRNVIARVYRERDGQQELIRRVVAVAAVRGAITDVTIMGMRYAQGTATQEDVTLLRAEPRDRFGLVPGSRTAYEFDEDAHLVIEVLRAMGETKHWVGESKAA